MPGQLLQYLISVQNKSGSIKTAPQSLLNLKNSINGVPLPVQIPGMSGVMSIQNLLAGIIQAAQNLGGFNNVGNFGNSLGALGALPGVGNNISNALAVAPALLANALPVNSIVSSVGGGASLGLALNSGYGQSSQNQQVSQLASGKLNLQQFQQIIQQVISPLMTQSGNTLGQIGKNLFSQGAGSGL
jgi:hypothetical protein